jgi:hypothetical protein
VLKNTVVTHLQSAYDQDATYRKKGSKQAVGYVLPEIRKRTGVEDVYADGGHYGEDVLEVAEKNSVNVHYTNMTGKGPNKIPITSFVIEDLKTIRLCPRNSAFRTNYYEETGTLSAHFSLADCAACPFNKEYWVKIGQLFFPNEYQVDYQADFDLLKFLPS